MRATRTISGFGEEDSAGVGQRERDEDDEEIRNSEVLDCAMAAGRQYMGYRCRTCGVWHDERPTCFGMDLPDPVVAVSEVEFRTRVERGSEQCVLDNKHFFILGNLDIPIRNSSEFIRWTVWSTLSEANYARSSELWHTTGRESEPSYCGWLSNQIPGYPSSINIKAMVQTEPVGIRPTIRVIEEGHPLSIDQEDGITEQRAEELIHAALHGNPR